MENSKLTEIIKKLRELPEVQQVETMRVVPEVVKRFSVKPYLRNMPESHFNSRNSGLDYRA